MNAHLQRRLYALGALLVAGAALAWISLSSMGEDLAYYLSPTELLDRGEAAVGPVVRLGGMVEEDSLDWRPDELHLAFRITDGRHTIPVEGLSAPPQMFREGIGVVVEGRLQSSGVFRTTNIMVKHSNEYRPPEVGERPEDVYGTLIEEGA